MRRTVLRVITAALLAAPSPAAAQARVTLVPSVSVGSIYDDNLFARTIGTGDQMTLITPGLEASYETPVKLLLGAFSFDAQRSFDHPALNELAARRHGLAAGRFQLSPHFTLAFDGRYDRTDSAGDLSFVTGVLLDRQRAVRWQVGPSFAFRAAPRVTITGLYDWTTETVVGAEMSDEQVARLGFTRQMTPRTTMGASYLGRRFVSAGETSTSTAALYSWSYEVAPATNLTLQGGPRYSSARDAVLPEIVLALGRKAATIVNYGFDYWRGESIILGVLGPVEIHSGTAHITWPIRQKVEVGVHGGVFNSQTLSQGHARVYHGELVNSWTLKAPLVLTLSYGVDFQRGDVRTSLLSDKRITRQVVLVRLTAAPRLTRSLRPDDPLQPLEPLADPVKGVKR